MELRTRGTKALIKPVVLHVILALEHTDAQSEQKVLNYCARPTCSDAEAVEAFLKPMTNFPPGSNRLNVTEETA